MLRMQRHIKMLGLVGATALGSYLCFLLAVPFSAPIVWAVMLAVLFAPMQRWLEKKLHATGMAAAISVCMIGLIVIVPASFVAQRLVMQAATGAELIESRVRSGEWRRAIEAQPRLAPLAVRIEQQINLQGTAKSLAIWLSNLAGSIVTGSLYQGVSFCLTLYLLFFLLRDRHAMLRGIRSLSPLSGAEMNRLFHRIGDTIFATIYGTLAVSSVQGLLGGLMFWWLGLSAPLLWGVVMALLAVIPVLGAFVVWIPAALFLLVEGHWGKALILAAWGLVVVGTIDNLLRPYLMGNRIKTHTALVFMSIVGGLIVFGAEGLVLGPVVLASTSVLLATWRKPVVRFRNKQRAILKERAFDNWENEGGMTPTE